MNHSKSEQEQLGAASAASQSNNKTQPNFLSALLALIATRAELIRLESCQVGQQMVSWAILCIVIVIAVFMGWVLLLVSIIVWCVTSQAWPWHWVFGGFAAAHLLVALIAVLILRRGSSPCFVTTREEFKKDRIWLESFHQKSK